MEIWGQADKHSMKSMSLFHTVQKPSIPIKHFKFACVWMVLYKFAWPFLQFISVEK